MIAKCDLNINVNLRITWEMGLWACLWELSLFEVENPSPQDWDHSLGRNHINNQSDLSTNIHCSLLNWMSCDQKPQAPASFNSLLSQTAISAVRQNDPFSWKLIFPPQYFMTSTENMAKAQRSDKAEPTSGLFHMNTETD